MSTYQTQIGEKETSGKPKSRAPSLGDKSNRFLLLDSLCPPQRVPHKIPIDFWPTIAVPYEINKNYQIQKSIAENYYSFRAVQQPKEQQYVTH